MPDLMPALLRCEHQSEAAVSRNLDAFERVHLYGDT
jgi:hypothetical protein